MAGGPPGAGAGGAGGGGGIQQIFERNQEVPAGRLIETRLGLHRCFLSVFSLFYVVFLFWCQFLMFLTSEHDTRRTM